MQFLANKKNRSSAISRATQRAKETAHKFYGMNESDVDFCNKQVKQARSSFVMRWGNLGIHRLLGPVGIVFAMYDKSVKRITFFIHKDTGLAIDKWARSLPRGRRSKKILLLPEVQKKAPLRASELPVAETGDLVAKSLSKLTRSEATALRTALRRRVRYFQDRIDNLIEMGPQNNWEMLTSLGVKVEELEAEIEAIPAGEVVPQQVPDVTRVDHVVLDGTDRDHDRRVQILEKLSIIEADLYTCPLAELCGKANVLEKLKHELFCLIPNVGALDRREALSQATTRLHDEILRVQKERSYTPGPHIDTDRTISKGLRSRLRVLTGMHRALFGTSYFMEPPKEEKVATSVADAEDVTYIPDRRSIMQRRLELSEQQDTLRKGINEGPIENLTTLYFSLDKVCRMLFLLPNDDSENNFDQQSKDKAHAERRMEMLEGHLNWSNANFDPRNIEVQDQRLADAEELTMLEARYKSESLEKEESFESPHSTELVQRQGH